MTEPTNLTPEERIIRGEEARALLEQPMMKAFLEHYEKWSHEQFKATDVSGSPEELGAELVWLRMLDQANQNFVEYFKRFIRDSDNAQAELLRMKRNPTVPIRSPMNYGNPSS